MLGKKFDPFTGPDCFGLVFDKLSSSAWTELLHAEISNVELEWARRDARGGNVSVKPVHLRVTALFMELTQMTATARLLYHLAPDFHGGDESPLLSALKEGLSSFSAAFGTSFAHIDHLKLIAYLHHGLHHSDSRQTLTNAARELVIARCIYHVGRASLFAVKLEARKWLVIRLCPKYMMCVVGWAFERGVALHRLPVGKEGVAVTHWCGCVGSVAGTCSR